MMKDHAIKFRPLGSRAWWFADPKGEGTRLRIRAARLTHHEAQVAIGEALKLNPDLEFKVVKF